MGKPATLKIDVATDVKKATAGLSDIDKACGDAARGLDKVDDAAGRAEDGVNRFGSEASDALDPVGGNAAKAAGGLGDVAGGLGLILGQGFEDKFGPVSTVFMAAAGSVDLFVVAQQSAAGVMAKVTSSTIYQTVATKTASAATKAWSIAQAALNAIMALNPIMLVVIAVAALVAAMILAYNKCDAFRAIVDKCWAAVKTFIGWLGKIILPGPLLVIRATVWLVTHAWDACWGAVKTFIGWLGRIAVPGVLKLLTTAVDGVAGAFSWVWRKGHDLWDWFAKLKVPSPFTLVSDAIHAIGDAMSWAWEKVQYYWHKFTSLDIPGPLKWVLDKVSGNATMALGAGPQTMAVAGGGTPLDRRAIARSMVVNVYLDGRRIDGYVTGVVDRRMSADGARLKAGAW